MERSVCHRGSLRAGQARPGEHLPKYPACQSPAVRSQSGHGPTRWSTRSRASRALLDGGREPGAVSKMWQAHSDQIARHRWRTPTQMHQWEMQLAAPWIRRRAILVSGRRQASGGWLRRASVNVARRRRAASAARRNLCTGSTFLQENLASRTDATSAGVVDHVWKVDGIVALLDD